MSEKNTCAIWTRETLLEMAEKATHGSNPEAGVSISFLRQEKECSVNVVELKKGIPSHRHVRHDEINQILEGEGKAVIDGEEKQLKPGDVLFCPRNISHSLHFPVKLLSIYTPSFDPRNPDRVFDN